MLHALILFLIFVTIGLEPCSGQGVAWSTELQDEIYWQLKRTIYQGNMKGVYREYLALHPEYEWYEAGVPDLPKVIFYSLIYFIDNNFILVSKIRIP